MQAPTVNKIEFSKPLDIIKYPDPRLRAVNAVVGTFDESIVELAQEMFRVMYDEPGVGLAAPQVGVNVRLMVFNPEGEKGKGQEYILVNPRVVSSSKRQVLGEEGCLSFPRIFGDVNRSDEIQVRAQNEKGEDVQLNLKGWVARIFQHEYDHLQGVLFHDRMLSSHLERARPQLVQLEEEYLQEHPSAQIRRVPPPPAASSSPAVGAGFGAGFGVGAKPVKKGFS